MKISVKGKSIIKRVALALAGVAALTAVGFGVKAIVDYTKNDLKTISPSFEVGNLGADGKFVDDESTLYTKEAFACEGLQVKLDFDNQINYQVFYYDILDNYVSTLSVLAESSGLAVPINAAYARLVIIPTNDEDGKISWTEKISYPKQMSVKVSKNQDMSKFLILSGKPIQIVQNFKDSVFESGYRFGKDENGLNIWNLEKDHYSTTTTLLKVKNGTTVTFNESQRSCHMFIFDRKPTDTSAYEEVVLTSSAKTYTSSGDCYVLFMIYSSEQITDMPSILSYFNFN